MVRRFLDAARVLATAATWKLFHQVEGQDAEDLPGAVGPVVLGRYRVEGETSLEFGVGLLMAPTSAHEPPEMLATETGGGHHGRVLEVAVRRVEQVELKVLPGPMAHSLAVDDHPQRLVPLLQRQGVGEIADGSVQPSPPAPLLDEPLETRPGVKGHLDGVGGPIYAEPQGVLLAQGGPDLIAEVVQEHQRGLAFLDIPGAVLDPEDLTRLSLIGGDGVVAGDLAVRGAGTRCSPQKRSIMASA